MEFLEGAERSFIPLPNSFHREVFMRPDKGKPYYTAYDKRYRSAYEQGADYWAYLPEIEKTRKIVRRFVERFGLVGRKVVEFGCGQGIAALEFARFGCIYKGYDISPAAIEKAAALLSDYTNAEVSLFDVVLGDFPEEFFDAGIDIACLQMLVTDTDRNRYLSNVYKCLRPQAAAYFVRSSYQDDAYDGEITSYEQWLDIAGVDVDTPEQRMALKDGKEFPVMMPLIAARPRTERGYRQELTDAGFEIMEFKRSKKRDEMSADILTRKP